MRSAAKDRECRECSRDFFQLFPGFKRVNFLPLNILDLLVQAIKLIGTPIWLCKWYALRKAFKKDIKGFVAESIILFRRRFWTGQLNCPFIWITKKCLSTKFVDRRSSVPRIRILYCNYIYLCFTMAILNLHLRMLSTYVFLCLCFDGGVITYKLSRVQPPYVEAWTTNMCEGTTATEYRGQDNNIGTLWVWCSNCTTVEQSRCFLLAQIAIPYHHHRVLQSSHIM